LKIYKVGGDKVPLYRYICENCGNEKVILHGMNETLDVICEECNSVMKRTIGRVGIIFKGEGFYITDSRNNKNNGKNKKDKEKNKTLETENVKS